MLKRCKNTLRQRLMLIAILTTGTALLVASSAMFVSQLISYRTWALRDITIKAEIIGNQCTAALSFNVPRDAEETLGALRADARIRYAAVYTANNGLFAVYRNASDGQALYGPAGPPGYSFSFDHIDMVQPIMLQGERIGSVFIRSDQQNLKGLLVQFSTAALLILLIALLTSGLLVSRLQQAVTRPVSGLVGLMERVSKDKDFSERAEPSGPRELCTLARGLNEMLQTIQERDLELQLRRQDLETSVTKLQRSTGELQEANRKLEALDKLKSDFISVVSHELRTPLTAIKAFVELLIVKQNMPLEKKTKLLQTVNDESDRLGRLINDLLDLSKIEAGTMSWRSEQVSIEDIIRVSVDMLLPAVRGKEVSLKATVEPMLPRFYGDRDRLVQVTTNILSNAVKFTPAGGSISVEVRREGGPSPQLVIAIIDTGMGIPGEELELIFDKFHRAGDMLTSRIEGTGLGLAIARQIVEHHGGRIWAVSTYGSGSTFTFTLPLGPLSLPGNVMEREAAG
jgi:signal transduction histidine kinase